MPIIAPGSKAERSFRTDEEEFCEMEGHPPIWAGGPPAWDHLYETVRPHRALGYKTPDQSYQDWLKVHPMRTEVLSDMS